MGFGLFNSESKTEINTTTQNYSNSFNSTTSNSRVQNESGNITLNLGQESATEKALPVVALSLVAFGAYLVLRK